MINRKWITQIGYLGIAGLLLVFTAASVAAPKADNKGKQKAEEEELVEIRKVSGIVSSLSENFIAVTYSQGETAGVTYEIGLYIDKTDLQVIHKRSLEQIKVGDTVDAVYQRVTTVSSDGSKRTKRIAKTISFVKSGEKELTPEEIREKEGQSMLPFQSTEE